MGYVTGYGGLSVQIIYRLLIKQLASSAKIPSTFLAMLILLRLQSLRNSLHKREMLSDFSIFASAPTESFLERRISSDLVKISEK